MSSYSQAPDFEGPECGIGAIYHYCPVPPYGCNAAWLSIGGSMLLMIAKRGTRSMVPVDVNLHPFEMRVIGTDQLNNPAWHSAEECPA